MTSYFEYGSGSGTTQVLLVLLCVIWNIGVYWAYYVEFGLLVISGFIMCNLEYKVLLVLLCAIRNQYISLGYV